MKTEFHLNKPMMCGRGVRVRELDINEVERLIENAATLLGKDATQRELTAMHRKECIKSMVVGITDPGLKTLAGAKWTTVAKADMNENMTVWFPSVRDNLLLDTIYERFNGLLKSEVDDIMGEAPAPTGGEAAPTG